MDDDQPADPWAPGSGASFERRPAASFESALVGVERSDSSKPNVDGGSRLEDGQSSKRRVLVVFSSVAVLAVAVLAGVIVSGSSDTDDSAGAPDPSAATVPDSIPGSLPAPDRTLDEVRLEDARRDTGDDVVLGVGDVPLTAGEQECPVRRLPSSINPRWRVGVGIAGPFLGVPSAVGDLVFVHTQDVGPGDPTDSVDAVTELVALDATDGSERWRTDMNGPAGEQFRVRDVIDSVVVLESYTARELLADRVGESIVSTVVGLDADSGEEVWRHVLARNVRVEIDPVGSRLVLLHSAGVQDDDEGPAVEAFDIGTGEQSWRHPGVLADIGRDGSVVVMGDTGIIWEAGKDTRLGFMEPDAGAAVVVGSNLVVAHGDPGSVTLFERGPDGGFDARSVTVTGVAGIDPPRRITQFIAMGDSSLLIEADGATYGANISGDTVELRWRRAGSIVRSAMSDRGLVVEIEPNQAVVHDIVDASTGRTIVRRSIDEVGPPGLHANGVTVTDLGDAGSTIVRALDLDGRERLTMTGASDPAVGDRVIVEAVVDPGRDRTLTVSAYGPVVDGPPRCGTVMREWVTS